MYVCVYVCVCVCVRVYVRVRVCAVLGLQTEYIDIRAHVKAPLLCK